jgi:hypothetical protein
LIRDDLSDKLIHLTRGESDQAAADNFLSILQSKTLKGGTGNIKGKYQCVCFSEAPIGKLGYILANPSIHGMRYKPFGVMVSKEWLYSKGGRPVIYQLDAEYDLLHESQKYRHVRYEPNKGVDFTWEREWRIQTAILEIDPNFSTIVVPNRSWEEWFQNKHTAMLGRRAMVTGFIGPKSVSKQPWHFIVLEDLGVPISSVDPPSDEN